MDEDNEENIGIAVEQINVDQSQFDNDPDLECLPILPTRNLVLFPQVTISIALKRQLSEDIARKAYADKRPIGIVCQKDADNESPALSGLYKVGVIADVVKVFDLPNDEKMAIVRGREAFKIKSAARKAGKAKGSLYAKADLLREDIPAVPDRDFSILIKKIRKVMGKLLSNMGDGLNQMFANISGIDNPEIFVNMLATNIPASPDEKQELLACRSLKKRATGLLKIVLDREEEVHISQDIVNRVRTDMDEEQRKIFLQRQMDAIHDQLYGDTDEAEILASRAEETPLSEAARAAFAKEMAKLRRLNPQNPDYGVLYTYLDTLLDLPWGNETAMNTDFKAAQEAMEQEHCGLENVKERILEMIAVLMHNPKSKSPILCLVGPPGVGKTSLGVSVAKALGREYQRVALGGLHDEAEIRGHRRTYIGAMPGRVIEAVRRAGTINPVLVLDEVDKLGQDYKGDPAAALLEVLDPEQNCKFHDNYIDVDFDLSHVLFMATANTLSTVPKPLIDRMEIIDLSGYLAEEKMEIARKHLLRRIFDELKIDEGAFDVSDEALKAIISQYTGESGVRQLEKKLSTIARKYLLAKLSGKDFPQTVEEKHLKDLLGVAPHIPDKYEGNEYAGVVTGLAWTEVGGEILLAEASLVAGKGKETFTGNLGDVMKESATIAFQWVKAHAQQLGIDPQLFEKYNLHLHFPEGAIPKDGPSAGITIATAIVSAFKQMRVKERIAMTGEITLRGKVLPVGGIKEKILAAKRAGITDIVLSKKNRKDIEDINGKYVEGLTFHYVDDALEVMSIAITSEKAVAPISLS